MLTKARTMNEEQEKEFEEYWNEYNYGQMGKNELHAFILTVVEKAWEEGRREGIYEGMTKMQSAVKEALEEAALTPPPQ